MANKLKSHSGAKKRFKKLKSGKIKFSRAYRRHLLTKKTAKCKRQLRGGGYLQSCDAGHVCNLI